MAKHITINEAANMIKNGSSIMIGGFSGAAAPLKMIDQIAKSGSSNLTLISVGAGYRGGGVDIGKLILNKQVCKIICSHVGTDPNLIKQFINNEIEMDLMPMGTFVERIRVAGAGLGAVVTPVGLGTEVEENAEKIYVDNEPFLLYKPLHSNFAIVKAFRADPLGNLQYKGINNTNPVMATAGDIVIAEVDEIVEVGDIPPEQVGTPGIYVDYIVQGHTTKERQEIYENLWIATNKL